MAQNVAIGTNAVAANSNAIAIGVNHAVSTVAYASPQNVNVTFSSGTAAFHVPNPPVTLETCAECGALVNSASTAAVMAHQLWHERIDVLLKVLDPARAHEWLEAQGELVALFQAL